MANSEDLKLLESGSLDLSGCDFSSADLSNRQLAKRNFASANLSKVKALSANLSGANFEDAKLVQLVLDGADCSGASFARTGIPVVSFENTNLQNADFSYTSFQRCSLRGADLRGANFRNTTFLSDVVLEGAIADERTSFDGAKGSRELSRLPMFAAYTYDGGYFRSVKRDVGATMRPLVDTTAPVVAPNRERVASLDEQDAEKTAQRLLAEPRLFANLANYAASSIRQELDRLAAQIPNDPEALDGYERFRDDLQRLQSGFQSLAEAAERVEATQDPPEKYNLAKAAVTAARGICSGFVEWFDQNGPQAGKVVAELGLIGVITGTLSIFTGVSPNVAFAASVAAVKGKSLWDVVAMFAPGKRDKSDK